MSSAAQRFNFTGKDCPRCFRSASLNIRGGLYECVYGTDGGCHARFKFLPPTETAVATLERVIEPAPEKIFCPGCHRAGFAFLCSTCERSDKAAAR